MNSSSYENGADGGTDEECICRICNMEETAQEPLYHPCKCRGSIEFVHQDCLGAWLLHSQRTRCELCKVKFRFSKEYSHSLHELHIHDVFRRLAIYGWTCIVTWARVCLVTWVWLLFLPWQSRSIWGMLFWSADRSWSSARALQQQTSNPALADPVDQGSNASIISKLDYFKEPLIIYILEGCLITLLCIVCLSLLYQMTGWVAREQAKADARAKFVLESANMEPVATPHTETELEDRVLQHHSIVQPPTPGGIGTEWNAPVDEINVEAANQRNRDGDVGLDRQQNFSIIKVALDTLIEHFDLTGDYGENPHQIAVMLGLKGSWGSAYKKAHRCVGYVMFTVLFCIWLPYNTGRVGLILIAHPIAFLRVLANTTLSFMESLADIAIFMYGHVTLALFTVVEHMSALLSFDLTTPVKHLSWNFIDMILAAGQQISETAAKISQRITDLYIPDFSATSHEALLDLRAMLAAAIHQRPRQTIPVNTTIVHWSFVDSGCAVILGYMILTAIGVYYFQRCTSYSTERDSRSLKSQASKFLRKIGGVMKVLLLMGIETLLIPLYCGLLFDATLLAKFDGANVISRMLCADDSSLISFLVAWCIGKSYMTQLEILDSYCKNVMQKRVLYLIHNICNRRSYMAQDVLNHKFIDQLSRIAIRVLAYSAIMMIYWGTFSGLTFISDGSWSSERPFWELMLMVMSYSSLIHILVSPVKSSGRLFESRLLETIASCLQRCSWILPLIHFTTDKRKSNTMGQSANQEYKDAIQGREGDLGSRNLHDGMSARAPISSRVYASDGAHVLLIDKDDEHINISINIGNGAQARSSSICKQVCIPLWCGTRILLRNFSIGVFTVFTTVSMITVPLLIGRQAFTLTLSGHLRAHDAYAFTIGIHLLNAVLYARQNLSRVTGLIKSGSNVTSPSLNSLKSTSNLMVRMLRALYFYTAMLIYFPTLLAMILQRFLFQPLYMYFDPKNPVPDRFDTSSLALVCIGLTTLVLSHANSRVLKGLPRLTRNGYLSPDIRLLNQAFIIPGTIITGGLFYPFTGAYIILGFQGTVQEASAQFLYKLSVVVAAATLFIPLGLWGMLYLLRYYAQGLWDAAFSTGERLQNFEE